MSRRETRDSDSKRHRSRFDREPSPKRSRRDAKPASEKAPGNSILLDVDGKDKDQKHRHGLQDALPLESPSVLDSKVEDGAANKGSDKKPDASREGAKRNLDPTEVPRPSSYFQHYERGNARKNGRSSGRTATTERGWWQDKKDQQNDRSADKRSSTHNRQRRDEKSQVKSDDNSVWCHDGFSEMEADPPPPAKKRPAFREKKIPEDSENAEKAAAVSAAETKKSRDPYFPVDGRGRREERGYNLRLNDKPDKESAPDMIPNRRERPRGGYLVRDGYGGGGGGGGNYRGRERFVGRQGYHHNSGTRVEKWKHDLFDETNRSPTPKMEEDQIAKVEALLAS